MTRPAPSGARISPARAPFGRLADLPLLGLALGGAALATGALALHAYRATTPILVVAALAALIATAMRDRRAPPVDRTLAILFALLLGWSALSTAWAIDIREALSLLPRLAGLFVAIVALIGASGALREGDRRVFVRLLLAGAAVGTALLLIETTGDAAIKASLSDKEQPIIALKPGSTVLALLVWPAVLVLVRAGRRALAVLLFLALLVPLGFLEGRAAFLALSLGAVVYALAWWAPRATTQAAAATSALLIVTMPLIAKAAIVPLLARDWIQELPFSAVHRLRIWAFVADRIVERPFLGWGLNAARTLPGGDRVIDPATGATILPLHPHNAALHLWLELGAPGALIGAVLAAALAFACRRLPGGRAATAAGLAVFATAFTVCWLSYGVFQNWWVAALGLAVALTAAAARAGDGASPSSGWIRPVRPAQPAQPVRDGRHDG